MPDKQYFKDYYEKNKQLILQRSAEWAKENRERKAELARIYRAKNKAKISEQRKKAYAEKKERLRIAKASKSFFKVAYPPQNNTDKTPIQ